MSSSKPPAKLVWTSDPGEARRLRESGKVETSVNAEPAKQMIRVTLDRKRRAGKTVTVASGFRHTAGTLSAVAATLKKKCGSGGTTGDGEIEIQGDHAERIAMELQKLGYRVKR